MCLQTTVSRARHKRKQEPEKRKSNDLANVDKPNLRHRKFHYVTAFPHPALFPRNETNLIPRPCGSHVKKIVQHHMFITSAFVIYLIRPCAKIENSSVIASSNRRLNRLSEKSFVLFIQYPPRSTSGKSID